MPDSPPTTEGGTRPDLDAFEHLLEVGDCPYLGELGNLVQYVRELERVLQAVAINAESWHCDEAGKSRALAVIAKWAKGEESPHPGITRA